MLSGFEGDCKAQAGIAGAGEKEIEAWPVRCERGVFMGTSLLGTWSGQDSENGPATGLVGRAGG